MSRNIILRPLSYLILFAGILCIVSCSDKKSLKISRSKGGLQVKHIPLTISDVPKELIQKINYPYVRFYKTELINGTDRPIKVIWFDGFFNDQGYWLAGNVRNKVLRGQDFIDWYFHKEDMDRDGWIRSGGKAICIVNWHWSESPDDFQVKWAYIGVDAQGNDYFIEAIVPGIKPVKLQ
ncbi:hypothetical protein ACFL2O_09180 [Thermodesulfobacteriota bacterium]